MSAAHFGPYVFGVQHLRDPTSPQVAMEKFVRAAVGECRRRGVVVCSVVTGEGVMLSRIAADFRVWSAGKSGLDLGLRRLGDELVLFS